MVLEDLQDGDVRMGGSFRGAFGNSDKGKLEVLEQLHRGARLDGERKVEAEQPHIWSQPGLQSETHLKKHRQREETNVPKWN